MNKWNRNITIIQVIRVCMNMIFSISLISLYWKQRGLDLLGIFQLQAIYAVSMVIFEIPTGIIGDKLGRKNTIVISAVICMTGWFAYSFANNFIELVICEILLGLGFAFLSGTDNALLYETLKEAGKTEEYTKIEGRQTGMIYISEAAATLSGGFLAVFFPIEFLMQVSGYAALTALVFSFLIREPTSDVYAHPKGQLYTLYKIGRFVFLKSKIVKFALPFMAASLLATMSGLWLIQSHWQNLKIPLWMFGFLWAAMAIPSAIGSHYAYKIENIIGKKRMIILMPLLAISGYLLTALVPGFISVIFIYLISALRGIAAPVLSRYINLETFNDKRATVLSIMNWIFRLAYFITAPFIGWIAQNYSVPLGFTACALISAAALFPFIPPLLKRIRSESG